ncbi:MAG TPA: hypothetical protein VHX59_02945 [Mycobacteriales bacterium]|jgi:hypothetical protein|nr:hypothetical protein [Mycobacteriales bacterium]
MVIDRRALVTRHNVRLTAADPLEPLSVGNGEFAFTADVTGLQTLREFHADGMRLGTHAHWSWHTAPNPDGFTLEESSVDYRTSDGRIVPYFDEDRDAAASSDRAARAQAWLQSNPHRLDLGRIGFIRDDGGRIGVDEIRSVDQQLDLWRGVLTSRFSLDGAEVRVTTACHPGLDAVSIRVESSLLASGRLLIGIEFPYAVGDWRDPCDWDSPTAHRTEVEEFDHRSAVRRSLDADTHYVGLEWSDGVRLARPAPHALTLTAGGSQLEAVIAFAESPIAARLPSVDETLAAAARHWSQFWRSGGAVDLAGSTDARAPELERRIVLSQYVTALNSAGSIPPAETGLVTNSWCGKFHLEMHWWHAAHFALWGRAERLERSLGWYERIRPTAREYANRQGYRGVRWPKELGPEARERPGDIGPFLVWQQPHPIYYAELLWRQRGDRETLQEYADIVFDTAEFMASYPVRDGDQLALGPPIVSAQENAFRDRAESRNPTFELSYWAWGLKTAQLWRERLGLDREARWDTVADSLAALPIRDGQYVELQQPVTRREGHPTMVGALGFVPDTGLVDHDVMSATVRAVLDSWDRDSTWGWDYPLLAMTACRLDQPETAVEALLLAATKNTYLANGHNFQQLPELPLYLPGNGGLLFAVAMMAAGWDGAPARPAPGFPTVGWRVQVEGINQAP